MALVPGFKSDAAVPGWGTGETSDWPEVGPVTGPGLEVSAGVVWAGTGGRVAGSVPGFDAGTGDTTGLLVSAAVGCKGIPGFTDDAEL